MKPYQEQLAIDTAPRMSVAEPRPWDETVRDPEFIALDPVQRLNILADHDQHLAAYMVQSGFSQKEAADYTKKHFEAWRMHVLDNGVSPGESAASELVTSLTDTVMGSVAGVGKLVSVQREMAVRAEDNRGELPADEQQRIKDKYRSLKSVWERGKFLNELSYKHGIELMHGPNDELFVDYEKPSDEALGVPDPISLLGSVMFSVAGALKEKTSSNVEKILRKNPAAAETFLFGKLPRGFGSAGGFLLMGAAGGTPAVAIGGAGVQAESAYFSAKEAGAKPEQIQQQVGIQSAIGMSEVFGLGGNSKWIRSTPFGKAVETGILRFLFGGLQEGAQEAIQGTLTDISEKYGGIDPDRNPFDTGRRFEEFSIAFLTGASLKGLERSEAVVALKAQKALNTISREMATSVMDGTHPAMRQLVAISQSEDATAEMKAKALETIDIAEKNASKLLVQVHQADAQADEAAIVEGIVTPAETQKTGVSTVLPVDEIVRLRDMTPEAFKAEWKEIPKEDRSRIRKAAGVGEKAGIAAVHSAIKSQGKDLVVEPDVDAMALPDLIAFHDDLSAQRGETPSENRIYETQEQLMDAVKVVQPDTETAQAAAISAVSVSTPSVEGAPETEFGTSVEFAGANWRTGELNKAVVAVVSGKRAPLYFAREKSQAWMKSKLADGTHSFDEIRQWRKEIEVQNEKPDTHDDSEEGLIEWFSDYAMDYLAGRSIEAKSLPQTVREFFARLAQTMTDMMRRVVRLEKALKSGKVSDEFENALAQSTGLQKGEAYDPYAGLSKTESAQLATMLPMDAAAASEYLAENEISDEVVTAYDNAKRRERNAAASAGMVQLAKPQVQTGVTFSAVGYPSGYEFNYENRNGKHIVTARDEDGNVVGRGRFIEKSGNLKYEPGGVLFVEPEHRRKGIASAIYAEAERITGKSIIPSPVQTGDGAEFSRNRKSFPQTDATFSAKKAAEPRMSRETLAEARAALTQITRDVRAGRAQEAARGRDTRSFTLDEISQLERGEASPKKFNLEPTQEERVKKAAQKRRDAIAKATADKEMADRESVKAAQKGDDKAAKSWDAKAKAAESRLKDLNNQKRIEVNLGTETRTELEKRLQLIEHTKTLERIIAALPKVTRANLGGFGTLVSAGSKGRLELLGRKAEQAYEILNRHAKVTVGNKIQRILGLGKIKKDSAGRPVGPAGAEVAATLPKIERYMAMTAELMDAEQVSIEAQIENAKNDEEEKALLEDLLLLNQYGNLEGRTADGLFQIAETLKEFIDKGRLAQKLKIEAFRAEMKQRRAGDIDSITGGAGIGNSREIREAEEKPGTRFDKLDQFSKKTLGWEWLMNAADRATKTKGTLRGRLAVYYGRMVHQATHAEARMIQEKQDEMVDALARIAKIEKKGMHWRLRVSNLWAKGEESQDAPVYRMELPRGEKQKRGPVPIENARRLLENQAYGTTIGLNDGQQAKVLEALQAHDEAVAAAEENLRYETEELEKLEGAGVEGDALTSAQKRAKDAKAELGKLRRQVNLRDVDLTDWSKAEKVQQKISQHEAIKMSMVYMQESQRENMHHWGYTPETMQQIEAWLTPESKQLRDWLLDRYELGYYEINPVFREEFGCDLPQERNYSPANKKTDKENKQDDFSSDIATRASVLPGFLISRVQNNAEPDFSVGALAEYQRHIHKQAHFIHWVKPMKIMRATLGHRDTRDAIAQFGGRNLQREISDRLEVFASKGEKRAQVIKIADSIRKRMVMAGLVANWTQFPKQLTGGLAYLYDVPLSYWVATKAEFAKDPAGTWNKMWSLPFVQDRFKGGNDRDIAAVMSGLLDKQSGGKVRAKSAMESMASTLGMLPTRAADLLTVVFDGYSAYRYGYDQYLKDAKDSGADINSEAAKVEADKAGILQFEMITERVQTDSSLKGMSAFEMGGSWQRLGTIFLNNPRMYYQSTYQAGADWMAGREGSGKEFIKRLAIGHLILPILFQFASDLSKAPFNDEDDKDFDPWRYAISAALGPLSGWFIFGQAADTFMKSLTGVKMYGQGSPLSDIAKKTGGSIGNLIADALEGGLTGEDIARTAIDITSAYGFLQGRGQIWWPIVSRTLGQLGLRDNLEGIFASDAMKEARAADDRWSQLKKTVGIVQGRGGDPDTMSADPKAVQTKLKEMLDAKQINAQESKDLWEATQRITNKRELTAEEKTIQALSTASGARAAYMYSRLREMSPGAKDEQIKRWVSQGLLSRSTFRQVQSLGDN